MLLSAVIFSCALYFFLLLPVIEFLASDQVITNEVNSKLLIADEVKNKKLYDEIRTKTSKVFPKAFIYFYGSRFYGLADQNSDLNIFVDIGRLFLSEIIFIFLMVSITAYI